MRLTTGIAGVFRVPPIATMPMSLAAASLLAAARAGVLAKVWVAGRWPGETYFTVSQWEDTVMLKLGRMAVAGTMLVASVAGAKSAQDACKTSSLNMFDSCKAGAASNRSRALGKCANLADAAAWKACTQ
jgi:hypothetical protein